MRASRALALPTLACVLALVACGPSRPVAQLDAGGSAPVVVDPPVKRVRAPVRVVSPLEDDILPGPERFAGIALPRGFEVTIRTGTRVVVEGPRGIAPVRRYLAAALVTPPQMTSRTSVYYRDARPRGISPDGQHVHVLAHTTSGTRVRIDITLVETQSTVPIEERLRKAGWGPNLRPPREQNQ